MHGWWLMDSACDGFEVVDTQRPRIVTAVPPDGVEGVVVEDDPVERVLFLDDDRKLACRVAGISMGTGPQRHPTRTAFAPTWRAW